MIPTSKLKMYLSTYDPDEYFVALTETLISCWQYHRLQYFRAKIAAVFRIRVFFSGFGSNFFFLSPDPERSKIRIRSEKIDPDP